MASPLTTEAAAAHYRALFAAAADPILVADENGHYLDANPAALSLLGYTLEELLQLHVSDVSAQAPAVLQDRYADLQRDRGWQGESVFRRKDGSVFTVEIRASRAVLPEGTLYFAAFRDLTERKRAEAQLHESEARLCALLDQLPVGVGLTDAEGRWVLTNGPMTPFVGEVTASRDPRRRVRWQVWDAHGRALAPTEWPAARAFRGETVAGVAWIALTFGMLVFQTIRVVRFHRQAQRSEPAPRWLVLAQPGVGGPAPDDDERQQADLQRHPDRVGKRDAG